MLRTERQVFLTLCQELLTGKVLLTGAIGGTMSAGHTAQLIIKGRERLNWSQQQLADELGVSREAVSQWEKGKGPKRSRLPDIARALKLPLSIFDPLLASGVSILDASEDKVVNLPLYNLSEISIRSRGELKFNMSDGTVSVDYNETGNLFAAKVDDGAMSPLYQPGDVVVVDRNTEARDQDAVVAGAPGNILMLREYKYLGRNSRGVKTYELRSTNADYPTIPMDSVKDLQVIGVVVEHRRRRKP